MKKLENKVAIVTGAGRGLGRGIALRLAEEGASIVVSDVIKENAESVVQEIEALKSKGKAVVCNVAKSEDVTKLFEECILTFGKVDIIVNNAGINKDAMLHKTTDEQWDMVIAVNLTGTFYMMREAAKRMREQLSGRIINIASMSWMGNIGQTNYSASKAGVIGMTKTAARELGGKGITANAICPGFIETDMTKSVPEKVWDIMVSKIPAGYAGKPSDVGNMVVFLSSDEASYINGQVIDVSGGMIL